MRAALHPSIFLFVCLTFFFCYAQSVVIFSFVCFSGYVCIFIEAGMLFAWDACVASIDRLIDADEVVHHVVLLFG